MLIVFFFIKLKKKLFDFDGYGNVGGMELLIFNKLCDVSNIYICSLNYFI